MATKPKPNALTLSGGRLSDFGGLRAVKEYRIWFHPTEGDDFYFQAKDLDMLLLKVIGAAQRQTLTLETLNKIEPPCAVVWDEKNSDWREVVLA